ncbi:hypothetical protein B9G55_10010 [Saccharibacillus sp. O16]|nr:hypothetical protein B9G55_10010 [Saccharibacillus sp. O16]
MIGLKTPAAILRRLLMPTAEPCLACGRSISSVSPAELPQLCENCAGQIPWIMEPRCRICGRVHGCPDCLRPEAQRRPFVINRSAAVYDDLMRQWIAEYKYGGREDFASPFSIMLEQTYHRMCQELSVQEKAHGGRTYNRKGRSWRPDVVTWVPVSVRRLEERGFNQTELMARQMALRLRLPAAELLIRSVHTDKQSKKTRAQRLHNLDDAFSLIPNLDPWGFLKWDPIGNTKHPGGPFPIRVLLVDDIYTTGTTAAVCSTALKRLEKIVDRPVFVYILTLARS